ncbi:MAG: cellulase, partial [Verrucomicrobia bacterium]|nr:cellulase [Verrucomicrobiota bacterium]
NADNKDQDWYFESIADNSAVAGERGDTFVSVAKSANAQPMITIPMLDWVAKLGPNRSKLASFSIAKYGPQTGNDWQWFPDAGNGVLTSGANVTNNDPNDANVPSNSTFQQNWVQHLVGRWGTNVDGGVRYYILDNEHSIWHSTHRDVHPTGATMDEMRNRIFDFAAMIKNNDPGALVVGPEEWGWSGYFYSGYDQQYGAAHGWSAFPDRAAHGGADYLPWLLDQLRQNQNGTGRRLLDVFTVHFYPQGGEFSEDISTAMQLRRNQSTRSLWDPNYVDQTWINVTVKLIPRMRSWTNTYYPGTSIGITEYNWGAEGHINGATAQADILGIFGRENLDLAARWTTPDSTTPTYKAMKIFRNYDGNKSGFGDTSVATAAPNPDTLSAFGAIRSSDNALTIVVISKTLSGTTPVTINVTNQQLGTSAQVWQLTSANSITRLTDLSLTSNSVGTVVPPQSITLFVISTGSGSPTPTPTPSATATPTPTPSPTATPTPTPTPIPTPAPSAPSAPTNLRASAATRSRIDLTWTDNSTNESGFKIEHCAGAGCTNFAQIATVAANVTGFSNTGLIRSKSYSYRVRAYNGSGDSAYSNTATAKFIPRR